jgi:hypothetical protein
MSFPDIFNMATPDLLFIIAAVLNAVGFAGTFIPGIPGPPLSFVGLVLCCFAAPNPVIIVLTVIMFLFVVAVTVLDFVVPGWLTNKVGGCKKAVWGATLGLFVGLFYAPIGLIAGPFVGAFLGEYTNTKKWKDSLKVAAYTLLSVVVGTVFKLVTCIAILLMCGGNAIWYYFIK